MRWPRTTTRWRACRDVPYEPAGDVAPLFAAFCAEHRTELAALIATRTTQTNEVGRCTALFPGLCHVASLHGWEEPLSLLDLGTSAGLNLLFDDYSYTYRAADGGASMDAGAAASPVLLECSVRDGLEHLPELRVPDMATRVGLDLAPVDPFSDDAARWLLACQWPDNPPRFVRLRAALAHVRTVAHPPRLERGDMVTDLPRVAATIPGHGPLVVFHSWVAAYLDEEQQRTLAEEVRALGGVATGAPPLLRVPLRDARPPHAPLPGAPRGARPGHRAGPPRPRGRPPVRLADTHPHGYWIRWWPATRPAPTARRAGPVPPRPRR